MILLCCSARDDAGRYVEQGARDLARGGKTHRARFQRRRRQRRARGAAVLRRRRRRTSDAVLRRRRPSEREASGSVASGGPSWHPGGERGRDDRGRGLPIGRLGGGVCDLGRRKEGGGGCGLCRRPAGV